MTIETEALAHTIPAGATVRPDIGAEARWAAWVARGEAHERRARRKLVVLAVVLALGAAVVYAVV